MSVETTLANPAERMARVRALVREGTPLDTAAQEAGVDPLIAQLWLRLPDDLWPKSGATPVPAGTSTQPPAVPGLPLSGLRRVLTCRIPRPAYDRLRAGFTPMIEAAVVALQRGLDCEKPEVAAGGWRFPRRPLALPLSVDDYAAVVQFAHESFDGDSRDAAGWLIARGMGMALPLPTKDELAYTPPPVVQEAAVPEQLHRPGRRPEVRAPLPPDDAAPTGDELRQMRKALVPFVSQRDLAAASGLSRGLVAGVELGTRCHVLTRLRMSEALVSLAKDRKLALEVQVQGHPEGDLVSHVGT